MPAQTKNPDSDFEQSFFQLAYDKLQEKLFNLLPFLIGFEIVNKSDDGTKALGVFAFKSNNDQVIYVPAFFIDGNVKGLDILYSKNNEQFYPLNEDFAELFLKDDVTGLGDASRENKDAIQKDMSPVDLRNMVTPPRTGKISFASVIDFVTDNDNIVKRAFASFMENNSDFCESVLRFYDIDKVAEAITPSLEKEAEMFLPIRIVTMDNKIGEELTETQAEKLATDGVLLIDKRAEDEKAKLGLFKYVETFTNPTKSGFYNYVTRNGGLRYGMVFYRPMQLLQNFSTNSAIVVDLSAKNKGQAYIVNAQELFIKDQYEVKDFSEVHKKMEEVASVEPSFDKTYILVGEDLKATQPFRVISNAKDQDGVRRIKIELDYTNPCCYTSLVSSRKGNNYEKRPSTKVFTLVLTKTSGSSIQRNGTNLYVPKGYKLFQLFTRDWLPMTPSAPYGSEEYEKYNNERDSEESRIKEGKPGSLTAVYGAMMENHVYPFSLHSNGSDYFVNMRSVRKKYKNQVLAKLGMVVHFGLDEKIAEDLVKSVIPGIKKEGYIKLAYTGEYTPYLRDENPYNNELGQPTYAGQGYEEAQSPSDGYTGNPTALGKGVMPDIQGIDSSIGQATQLAQAGQKNIFDTQAIATLAKYVTPSSKIFQYMPSFVKAMDELGRLLFLCYWETEKFEEMYGRSEVPELVELLKNVFTNIGDMIIFLKRKSPELSINMVKEELSV